MIKKDIRVNNEFYVCPVYNEAIGEGKKIVIDKVSEMHGLGTPDDLKNFITKKNLVNWFNECKKVICNSMLLWWI